MEMSFEACSLARRSRDPRFDGRFYVAVLSTGIYCRPICPAPLANEANQRFFTTAAEAEAAGFRPCLRCRPERAPMQAAGDDVATRALARIERPGGERVTVAGLAADLDTSSRHLHRACHARFGLGPRALIASRRLRLAKRLLDDSDAGIADVAFTAGFGSVRAFNTAVAATWGRCPTSLRRLARQRRHEAAPPVGLELRTRPPFAHRAMAEFLERRAVAGLESFEDGTLLRHWNCGDGDGTVAIRFLPLGVALEIDGSGTLPLTDLLARVRRLVDLDADSAEIDGYLGRDPMLGPSVRLLPGRRVPGMWDPFEGAVRAVLGQQVSVAAARTLTARLLALCGPGRSRPVSFPEPERLLQADLDQLGIPRSRIRALRHLAQACAEGRIDFGAPSVQWREALLAVPGIGPWTADYLIMRAGRDPDAFPAGDLVVRARLGAGGRPASERAAIARAEVWRPWRAYAVLQLWASAAGA